MQRKKHDKVNDKYVFQYVDALLVLKVACLEDVSGRQKGEPR
jgi:hypothetical protein